MCPQPLEIDPKTVELTIEKARDGSADAIGSLLKHYGRFLLKIANEELSSGLAAKVGASDLVQETCLQAGRDFARFKGKTEEEFRGWLRQSLMHNIQDLKKRFYGTQKRRTSREIPIQEGSAHRAVVDDLVCEDPSPSEVAVRREIKEGLAAAIERLPNDYRSVLELRLHERLSYAEIGARLGRSAEAARKLWARAIDLLASELESDGSGKRRRV